jgi:pSer/pThr/pTyr-binding forkhead associated (FHA) protein
MTKLYVLEGPDKGRSFDLEGGTVHIGRSRDNHIQLKDTYVSRRHLRLLRKGAKYFIHDLESKNGTFVDGEPISPGIEFEVKEGLTIIIGVSVICLGEGCLEEVKAFLDSMDVSKVSKEDSESDTIILELDQ